MALVLDASPAPAAAPAVPAKPSLAGLGREGLRAALSQISVPEKQLRMRTEQLWSWVYVRGITAFEEVSPEYRALLTSILKAYPPPTK